MSKSNATHIQKHPRFFGNFWSILNFLTLTKPLPGRIIILKPPSHPTSTWTYSVPHNFWNTWKFETKLSTLVFLEVWHLQTCFLLHWFSMGVLYYIPPSVLTFCCIWGYMAWKYDLLILAFRSGSETLQALRVINSSKDTLVLALTSGGRPVSVGWMSWKPIWATTTGHAKTRAFEPLEV